MCIRDRVSTNPPPDHVSPSQVSAGEACGLQLRLYRRDGVPEWPAWWNVGGTAVHACIELIERQRIDEHSELYVHVIGGDPDACAEAFMRAFDNATPRQSCPLAIRNSSSST